MKLSVKQAGVGQPLLILHGLFGSGTNWRSLSRDYQRDYSTYLVDLRNHGSSPHASEMDYTSMAADVLELMNDLDLAQAVVIGHSMGGKTAMKLALESPERVSKLLVVDIAPAPSTNNHVDVIDALVGLDFEDVSRRADVDGMLKHAIPDAALRAFLLQNLELRDGQFTWRLNLTAIRDGMSQLLDFPEPLAGTTFTGPTLFLRGDKSDYVSDTEAQAIKRLFPQSSLTTVANAGHWLHAEQPRAFQQIVGAFLDIAI